MDSASSHQVANPKRLKNLACNVEFSEGNTLLHQFVLDNSDPNDSASGNYITAVLRSMSDVPSSVVNALNNDGYSALHLAVLKNNLLMVKKLLSCPKNVDVNARRRSLGEEYTALHLAAKLGHLSIIQELLDKGAGIDIESGKYHRALCFAIWSRDLDVLKLCVNNGANVNLKGNMNGHIRTPLSHAASLGNLAMVEFLIGSGADVSADRFSVLLLLAITGNLDILKFLLDKSVNFDIKSERGCEVLLSAVGSGNLATVEFLVRNGADANAKFADEMSIVYIPLHAAVKNSSLKIVEYLVSNGADVNAKNGFCATPLHLAVYMNSLETVAFLIDHGADLEAADERGETPIHCAVFQEHLECVAFLLDQGADLDAADKNGMTPLHYAVYKKNFECAALLLDRGANLRVDLYGWPPLQYAVVNANLECAALLLDRGADLRADIYRWTPLHYAAYTGHVGVLRAILDKGADVNAKNKHGQTPLDIAREYENQSCIDVLQNVRCI